MNHATGGAMDFIWTKLSSPAEVSNPHIALRQNRTAALALGLSVAIAFGLVSGVGFTVSSVVSLDAPNGFARLLVSAAGGAAAGGWAGYVGFRRVGAVAFGLGTGTVGVLARAWGGFVVGRGWLALRGRLPWRLMRFLDDAHRRGVLRQSGAVYEFRHARLQDHLADPRSES